MYSIIIPTFNRSASLSSTLHALAGLHFDTGRFEIIIVDNGSTDDTRHIVDQFKIAHARMTLRYVYDNVPGLLTGRHRGASEAKGDILCFVDDDVEVSPGWLASIANGFEQHDDVNFITGPCLPKYEVSPPEWLPYFTVSSPYGGTECSWLSLQDLGPRDKEINPTYVWGLNYSIRKSAFDALGGFHPDNIPSHLQMFQGDGESGLALKGLGRGFKAMYCSGALLYHQVPENRMTRDYFGKRGYYGGVSSSFTMLREQHLTSNSQVVNDRLSSRLGHRWSGLKTRASHTLRIFGDSFYRLATMNWKAMQEGRAIHQYAATKYNEGYQFHQQAFKDSAVVRQWVLRENYLNYKLPDDLE